MSCGVCCRPSSDLMLLWLWHGPAATGSDSTPSLETSMCHSYGPEKQTKQNKTKQTNKKANSNKFYRLYPLSFFKTSVLNFPSTRMKYENFLILRQICYEKIRYNNDYLPRHTLLPSISPITL